MTRITLFRLFAVAIGGLAIVHSSVCQDINTWDFEGRIAWDSKYVSEGRDNLKEGGLRSAEVLAFWRDWELGGFVGEADSVDYGEVNLWAAKSWLIGSFDVSASYTHLSFWEDDSNDSEFALEAATFGPWDKSVLSLAAVYVKEADGLFFEMRMEREVELRDGYPLVPYVLLSANSGYVADEPNGLNHAQFGVSLRSSFSESVTAEFYANISLGIADGVENVAWFGVSLGL